MAEQRFENRFGEWIKRGGLLYRDNFLVLFTATLLAFVGSGFVAALIGGPMLGHAIACGGLMARVLAFEAAALGLIGFAVLGGPLFAGLALLTLGLLDAREPSPGIGELFKGFQYYVHAFLFVAAWGVISVAMYAFAALILSPLLLPVVPVALSLVVGVLSMFGLFLIVDKGRSFRQAFVESIRLAREQFWIYAAVVLVVGAIGLVGAIVCGVGVLLTLPVCGCILAVVYRDAVKPSN